MSDGNRPPMSGGLFNRDVSTRASEDQLDLAWSEPGATVVLLQGRSLRVQQHADGSTSIAFRRATGSRTPGHHYLGRLDGRALFCLNVGTDAPEGENDAVDHARPEQGQSWQSLFTVGAHLSAIEAEIAAVALALTSWHASMGFSPRDGEPTTPTQGGWARRDQHGGEHFPRMDPVVIVLVEDGNRLLLGSNALWESGRFSLLAGYVEAGESAEQAVVREIFEESGMRVENVTYVASQPWPFPRSFMMGFRAQLAPEVDAEALVPDVSEISELRWFTREELSHPAPGIQLPGEFSIARWLIDRWVAEGDD